MNYVIINIELPTKQAAFLARLLRRDNVHECLEDEGESDMLRDISRAVAHARKNPKRFAL